MSVYVDDLIASAKFKVNADWAIDHVLNKYGGDRTDPKPDKFGTESRDLLGCKWHHNRTARTCHIEMI